MSRGTRAEIVRAVEALPGCAGATLEELRPGVVVVRATWRVGLAWPVESVRDHLRDAMNDQLAVGVRWIAVVNESLVVRPARLTIWSLRRDRHRVGDRVRSRVVRRFRHDTGLDPLWHLERALNVALWWRRTDLHVVTRVTTVRVECERLRWSWASWRYVVDWTPDELELEVCA